MKDILTRLQLIDVMLADRSHRQSVQGYYDWRVSRLAERSNLLREYRDIKDDVARLRSEPGRTRLPETIVIQDPNDPGDLLYGLHLIVSDLVTSHVYQPNDNEKQVINQARRFLGYSGFFV